MRYNFHKKFFDNLNLINVLLIVFSKIKQIVESEIGVWEHLNHLHRLEKFMCYGFER